MTPAGRPFSFWVHRWRWDMRKEKERDNQQIWTSQNVCQGWHWLAAPHCLCRPVHFIYLLLALWLSPYFTNFNFRAFRSDNKACTHLQAASNDLLLHYCHFPTVYLMLTMKKDLCLCILKNSSKSVNVGQELQLVNPLMARLNVVFRGQSRLWSKQLIQHYSTFLNHSNNPVMWL